MTYEDALAILRDGWPITPEDLTQIAAHIWDEGEKVGYVHGQHDAHRFDPGPDYTETPNPYKTSETA